MFESDFQIAETKLKEFTKNWHRDRPFLMEEAGLGGKYDFVSYLMKCLRSHLVWGSETRHGRPTFAEAFSKSKPAQCLLMSKMLSRMVSNLGMPSAFVNFRGPETSHWGLDVELDENLNHWAFFDPTYAFCMKDRRIGSVGIAPLNSAEIAGSKRVQDLLQVWHMHFNQLGHSFDESQSMAHHFKQPRFYRPARKALNDWKRDREGEGLSRAAHQRTLQYLLTIGGIDGR